MSTDTNTFAQFHPEKNMFEWAPRHPSIPHSRQYDTNMTMTINNMTINTMTINNTVKRIKYREATSVSLYMVEHFVEAARRSSHQFPSRWFFYQNYYHD